MHEFALKGYSVVRQLDGGGMTNLYVAHDAKRERVVIRVPKEAFARDRRLAKAFQNGARILAGLEHPNVCRLIEAGKTRGLPYMVVEYIEAVNLRQMLVERSPFVTDNALSLIRQIGHGLYAVHRGGFLHLDMKPENLLIRDDGHVFLIDFDLALPKKRNRNKLKQLPGTVSYLAPETLRDRLVNEQTDIYSFGVIAYEMSTFHKPYEADTAEEVLRVQLDPRVAPTPMRKHNAEVPSALEAVISKCLAKAPDTRYPDMSLIIKDLEAIL